MLRRSFFTGRRRGALGSLRAQTAIIGKEAGSDFRDRGDGTAAGCPHFLLVGGERHPWGKREYYESYRVMISLGKPANFGFSTYLPLNPPPITPAKRAMASRIRRITGKGMAFPSPNSMARLLHD